MTPEELATENLKRVCAVTGAHYIPDHQILSPINHPDYPGPWVRIAIGEFVYYILVGHIVREYRGVRTASTCYYSAYPNGASATYDTPMPEQVAAALLLLRHDPKIFDRWASHTGAYA